MFCDMRFTTLAARFHLLHLVVLIYSCWISPVYLVRMFWFGWLYVRRLHIFSVDLLIISNAHIQPQFRRCFLPSPAKMFTFSVNNVQKNVFLIVAYVFSSRCKFVGFSFVIWVNVPTRSRRKHSFQVFHVRKVFIRYLCSFYVPLRAALYKYCAVL